MNVYEEQALFIYKHRKTIFRTMDCGTRGRYLITRRFCVAENGNNLSNYLFEENYCPISIKV